MVDVETSILLNVDIQSVSTYVSNPDHAPEWYDNIKSIEWKTEKPLQIGSLLAFKAQFLGKEMAYVYKVTELSDNIMVMRTEDGPFPMQTSYIWEEVEPGKTKMILRNTGRPSGFSFIFSPFMKMAMKRANNKDLKKLKIILENKIVTI